MQTILFYLRLAAVLSSSLLFDSCPATSTFAKQSSEVQFLASEEAVPINTKSVIADNTRTGMGYIILNSDSSFQSQVKEPDTIYEIRTVFDLSESGGKATIPEGCILKFLGGKICNGVLYSNNTEIEAPRYQIFENCTLSGFDQPLHSRWWCVLDGRDNTSSLQDAFCVCFS